MINEDDIILLKRASKNTNAFLLKAKNGKTYLDSSLSELFKKSKNEEEFEYLIIDFNSLNEEKINYILKITGEKLKIYIKKDDEIIEFKI